MGRVALSNQLQRWSLEEHLIIGRRRSHLYNRSFGGSVYE
jgi:hypothetical protein